MLTRTLASLSSLGLVLVACGAPPPDIAPQQQQLEQPQPPRPAAVGPAKHCVARSNAARVGAQAQAAQPPAEPDCFDSFSEAIAFATKGAVKLPADATPATLSKEQQEALGKGDPGTNSFVIGVEYSDIAFGGASFTIWSDVSCNGYWHEYNFGPTGWNDQISSARAYSYCNHSVHYENSPYAFSALVDCGQECWFIGNAMNDQTSWIRWYQ